MKAHLFCGLLIALLAGACYDLEQRVQIRVDGSGTLFVAMTLSDEVLALVERKASALESLRGAAEKIESDPNVLAVEVRETRSDGRHTFEARAEIEDLTALDAGVLRGLFGGDAGRLGLSLEEFTVEPCEGGFRFHQRLAGPRAGGGAVVAAAFDDSYLALRLAGGRVASHNGELTGKGEVRWRVDLADLYSGTLEEVEFNAVLGGQETKDEFFWRLVGALGLVGVGAGLWRAGRVKEA